MAHEQHFASDKKPLQQQEQQQQYASPDTSFSTTTAIPATAAPPSPPPSSASSTTSLTASPSRPRLEPRPRRRVARTAASGLPKSVVSAHRCIEEAQRGRYAGPSWLEVPNVCPADLKALISAVEATSVYKLRYDYDPTAELLTLRMPEGKPHNFTKTGFEKAIWERLKERLGLATREDGDSGDEEHRRLRLQALRTIESSILSTTEAELKLPTDKNTKFPDISFYYKGHVYPSLVVEVGHSQKGLALPLLAREYIEKTSGDIHTVVTVDIDHNKREQRTRGRRRQRSQQEEGRITRSRSRQRQSHADAGTALKSAASLSLFRLGRRILCDRPFRDSEGEPVDGSLELNVADFVPQDADISISRASLETLTFSVPFRCLYDALTSGEQLQALEEETPPPESEVQRTKKRVHFEFDWDAGTAAGEGQDNGEASYELRSSQSKRRRTNSAEEPRGHRPSSSHDSEQGHENSERRVIAHRRRRSNSHQQVPL